MIKILNPKQRIFISEYLTTLNATNAALKAGYSAKTAYSQGQRLLKRVEIKNAIEQAMTERENTLIADRQERQKFWSAVMRNTDEDMKNRLRSSELLAKANGDFVEKIQANVQKTQKYESMYDYSKLSKDELLQLRALLIKATPEKKGDR